MSSVLIFDTSVIIDQVRTGCHQARIDSLGGLIRSSSVVLAELWRGASTVREREFLTALEKNHRILTPTTTDWLESGRLLAKMRPDKGLESANCATFILIC